MDLSHDTMNAAKETLLAGGYSLLLGAGVNLDSKNRMGQPLPSGDALRKTLIGLTDLRSTSSLSRAYSQLTEEQIRQNITEPFSGCSSGPTADKIADFVWKRIYSLNVDDSLEDAYKRGNRRQKCLPFTHKDIYHNPFDPSLLQVAHIHGWAAKPEDGYVFSLAEYVGGMGPGNPWVNVLAQTITSEPFIIGGTILEETDLEYFLKGRNTETVRRDRGPSFLIEPYPDRGTIQDCERHGLTLYEGTFLDFLNELDTRFPNRPLPITTNVRFTTDKFTQPITPRELALFSMYFSYVIARNVPENIDLGFYVGREPTFDDIALERDISRASTIKLKNLIRNQLANQKSEEDIILFDDNAGSGKSTIAYRVLYDLAAEGCHVFVQESASAIDIELCLKMLSLFKFPFVLFCDDFADNVSSIMELRRRLYRSDIVFFGVERSYRIDHIVRMLAGTAYMTVSAAPFALFEAKSLIAKMEQHGLTSESHTLEKLDRSAAEIAGDSIAVAVCRIMHDFRPIERIVKSLVVDADPDRLERYLACGLASYCYRQGISYSILASCFKSTGISSQFNARDKLPLVYSDKNSRDYVVPASLVLGQRVLHEVSSSDADLVFETYCGLGSAIASYVNRAAVKRRTPEARLAGRLFDFDEVVFPFLGSKSENFYIRMKRHWEWNSRYWEQLALLKLHAYDASGTSKNYDLILQAISHAKHAVRVERHPLPLTTLGKVLLEEMKHNPSRRDAAYEDALKALSDAIRLEGQMSRIAIHPYSILLAGTLYFVKMGGAMNSNQKDNVRRFADDAERFFRHETALMITIANLRSYIQ